MSRHRVSKVASSAKRKRKEDLAMSRHQTAMLRHHILSTTLHLQCSNIAMTSPGDSECRIATTSLQCRNTKFEPRHCLSNVATLTTTFSMTSTLGQNLGFSKSGLSTSFSGPKSPRLINRSSKGLRRSFSLTLGELLLNF